jgi:hypothetical protein
VSDDADLVTRAAAGDDAAFGRLELDTSAAKRVRRAAPFRRMRACPYRCSRR